MDIGSVNGDRGLVRWSEQKQETSGQERMEEESTGLKKLVFGDITGMREKRRAIVTPISL